METLFAGMGGLGMRRVEIGSAHTAADLTRSVTRRRIPNVFEEISKGDSHGVDPIVFRVEGHLVSAQETHRHAITQGVPWSRERAHIRSNNMSYTNSKAVVVVVVAEAAAAAV
jgi:hypothetical protein